MGISVTEFVHKWQRVELTERSTPQQHFLDLKAMGLNLAGRTIFFNDLASPP